ncbi:SUMF1/EgtB/PvdO family nonheme iron enzyme [Desertivirga arenae]|uniref:type IX secretion system lipoprotein PorK/GldK n=1 Tax=Desertivirga arenae TaxID=2810309 RepID=UPI001A9775BB|nr:SUMF1/EgtB/PvdO family nonheme iron enzyme [Pedobacter sp. SYSU D00823]
MNEFDLSLKSKRNGVSRTKLISKISVLAALLIAETITSCKSVDFYEAKPVYSSRGKTVFPPPGMVYVPAGTVIYKSSAEGDRKVSLSPFFMDATEVTNYQYREFVNWVADSIAVVDILKDEKYFISSKKSKPAVKSKKGKGASTSSSSVALIKSIDWDKVRPHGSKTPLWQNRDAEIQSKLQEAKLVVEINGRNSLNKEMVKYGYFFRHAAGPNADKYVKENISVVPETDVWINDFPNSQVELMTENYYQTKAFDHYPVVGVSWMQARAYSNWRTKTSALLVNKTNNSLRNSALNFSLPTESQWQYAATGGVDPTDKEAIRKNTLLTYKDKKSKKEKLLVNYKQGEGNYTDDGSTFTLPVKSYAPNSFGLYNMNGNVAEWTLDAFSPSAIEFVHDLNPVLQYDADDKAPAAMKRKVVRGGSWKDSGQTLDIESRNYELQDRSHSYIGFRCVMPAVEVITDQVRTRKTKELVEKSKKGSKDSKSSEPKKSKKGSSDKKSA